MDVHYLILEKGASSDASIQPASSRPPQTERNTGETHAPRNVDAPFVTNRRQTISGQTGHIGVALESDLIKTMTICPPPMQHSTQCNALLTGAEQRMCANTVYVKTDRNHPLRAEGDFPGILEKVYRNRVGRIFATLVKDYGYLKTRYTTRTLNSTHVLCLSMTLNVKRALKLVVPTPT